MRQRFSYQLTTRTILLLFVLIAGCSRFQESRLTGIPVSVYRPGTSEVDIGLIYEAATEKVHEILPRAYFAGMVFSGKCYGLLSLQGKIVFIFLQTRIGIPRKQVLRGVVTVRTQQQTMDLWYTDETNHYPNLNGEPFPGDHAFRDLVSLAHRHVTDLGISDCDITIGQLEEGASRVVGRHKKG